MSDLLVDLTGKTQREVGGQIAASRFDYQKDWAFCRMVRKHIEGESYLVAFEFHDDVLFMQPSLDPTAAEFCQVKTSASQKPRTLASLTSRPKGTSSVLGKMLSNLDGLCSRHDVTISLVSNNAFEFSDRDTKASRIDEKYQDRIICKLQEEIGKFEEGTLDKISFMVSGVSLASIQSFLEGEVLDLFCHRYGEDHGLNTRTWVRLIKSEIARRNNYPSNEVTSIEELLDKKCIDDQFVDRSLDLVRARTRPSFDVDLACASLLRDGWKLADIHKLKQRIPECLRDYYDPNNDDVQHIVSVMRSLCYDQHGNIVDLAQFLGVVRLIQPANDVGIDLYNALDYLDALGMVVYHDAI
jgi:hypothetical protein